MAKGATDIIRTENWNNAVLVIHSTTGWRAVVQDSDFVQQTIDGFERASIYFKCNTSGIFSNVVQKTSETGDLDLFVAQNGHKAKEAHTSAAYGVVSMAGNCE